MYKVKKKIQKLKLVFSYTFRNYIDMYDLYSLESLYQVIYLNIYYLCYVAKLLLSRYIRKRIHAYIFIAMFWGDTYKQKERCFSAFDKYTGIPKTCYERAIEY